jgi:ubiquitin-protein ligase
MFGLFSRKPKTEEEEEDFYEEAIHQSLKVTSKEDEILQQVLEQSKNIKTQEELELEKAIQDSIEQAEKDGIIKKKRPTKNTNKMIMYDYGEINNVKTIELTLNGRKRVITVSVELVKDNIHHWNVSFDSGKYLWGKMTWEILFTNDFPRKAPKIRVLTPVFKPYTGHITIGGAICNPILVTGQGWNSETEMLTVIISLIDAMVNTEQPAKLNDGDERVRPYTNEEAEAGRTRYLKNHGWKY